VKAHNDNFGNELADQLAKTAASRGEGETAYSKIPKSAVIKVIQEEGELEWQKRMECLNQRGYNKIILPSYTRPENKKTANGYKTFYVSNRARNIETVLP
jgi:hypothetical protein